MYIRRPSSIIIGPQGARSWAYLIFLAFYDFAGCALAGGLVLFFDGRVALLISVVLLGWEILVVYARVGTYASHIKTY